MSGAATEGWRCPKCGGTELDVTVKVWALLEQTLDEPENMFQTCVDQGDHEWDGDSPMKCLGCGFTGRSRRFFFRAGPAGTLLVGAERREKPYGSPAGKGRMGRRRLQGALGPRKGQGRGRGASGGGQGRPGPLGGVLWAKGRKCTD